MAEWSFTAIGRNDQSVGRRRGYFDAVAACGNRRGGSKIESTRNVPSRGRERTLDGTAPGFTGNTGLGLAGLVSCVPSRRRRGCDGGTIFYGRDDMARVAAWAGISGAFEQWRN